MVYCNNKQLINRLGIVEDMKTAKPNSEVSYVKMIEAHGKAGVFHLEPEVQVHCAHTVPEAGKDMDIANARAFIPREAWAGSPLVVATWATRWAPQGLMPVRPREVSNEDFELPPKSSWAAGN